MKIELKKITYNKRLSQETSAYAADVWINGVKKGTVQNAGHGGPDEFYPHTLETEINVYAKTLPPLDFHGMKLEQSAEILLGDILNDHLAAKDLQRILKTKTLFIATNGNMYTVKGAAPADAVKVFNTMPFDEALKLYRTK